jgi:hypothetical protein
MELEDIFLAKFADITPDGLFTVVGGGVNRIEAGGFPWAWGLMFLLVRIRMTADEARKQHVTAVERESPGGKVESIGIDLGTTQLPAATTPDLGPDGKVGIVISVCLTNLIFPEPGVYGYRFKLDGQIIGVATLLVTPPRSEE